MCLLVLHNTGVPDDPKAWMAISVSVDRPLSFDGAGLRVGICPSERTNPQPRGRAVAAVKTQKHLDTHGC